MKKIITAILIFTALFFTACGTVSTTTTTKYDANGNVSEIVVTESDASDFAAYMMSGDGCATVLSADVSKFNIGYSGWGLSWFSVLGTRTKAPVNNDSNSAEALEKTADVISATKTSLVTDQVSVNAPRAETSAASQKPIDKAE